MQISIIRQTPAASILLMLLLVAMTFTRFAIAPYGDELIVGVAAPLGSWCDMFQAHYPVWGGLLSALIVVMIATKLGRMTSALGLYHVRTTISIPLYVIIACGIFIPTASLSVIVATYFVMQMLRHLCGVYVRGTDLNYAFYAGLCIGFAPLFYAPTAIFTLLLPIAILMFGLSWREVTVMIAGALLPLLATAYIGWLCGYEFTAPIIALVDAITTPSNYTLWESESVVALTLMGFILFVVICGIASFVADKHSLAVRPRTIMTFQIITLLIACAAFALPSATTGLFFAIALPAASLIPIALIRLRDLASNLTLLTLLVLVILHLFIA